MQTARQPALTTLQKALDINLDPARYGTFAEIGAGQEVVRWFFQAGGAAGTISKSISAYDMQVSDAIYGDCKRYVSRPRLEAMLQHEQRLNRERLAERRGQETCFFTFADTVSARNFHGTNQCHAWLGVRFQHAPGAADSEIIVHLRMHDDNNAAQQEAIGIVGVNLVYGAFKLHTEPKRLLSTLIDNLSPERVEIDMVEASGPAFAGVDNRVLTLRLVELGLTGAAMFAADGGVLQPSEALRKRPLLVQRGRFRPVTHVNVDMLQASLDKFSEVCSIPADDILPLLEMSMHNLKEHGEVCLEDFVSRAEVAAATGCTVMISDFPEYHRLAAYLTRYTQQPIALPIGLATLRNLFEEKYYDDLDGGILEGMGRLFRQQLRLFVYPCRKENNDVVEHLDDVRLEGPLQTLYTYLRERGCLVPLTGVAYHHLHIFSHDVLAMIAAGDDAWRSLVPEAVAEKITASRLFGYTENLPRTAERTG